MASKKKALAESVEESAPTQAEEREVVMSQEAFNELLSEWGWRMDATAMRWYAPRREVEVGDGRYIHFSDIHDAMDKHAVAELVTVIQKMGVRS